MSGLKGTAIYLSFLTSVCIAMATSCIIEKLLGASVVLSILGTAAFMGQVFVIIKIKE